MLTRCPNCQTTFRVTPDQLKAGRGRVRCGVCRDTFDAFDGLVNDQAQRKGRGKSVTAFPHRHSANPDTDPTEEQKPQDVESSPPASSRESSSPIPWPEISASAAKEQAAEKKPEPVAPFITSAKSASADPLAPLTFPSAPQATERSEAPSAALQIPKALSGIKLEMETDVAAVTPETPELTEVPEAANSVLEFASNNSKAEPAATQYPAKIQDAPDKPTEIEPPAATEKLTPSADNKEQSAADSPDFLAPMFNTAQAPENSSDDKVVFDTSLATAGPTDNDAAEEAKPPPAEKSNDDFDFITAAELEKWSKRDDNKKVAASEDDVAASPPPLQPPASSSTVTARPAASQPSTTAPPRQTKPAEPSKPTLPQQLLPSPRNIGKAIALPLSIWPWWLAITALILLTIAQLLYVFRFDLAEAMPQMRPALQQGCALLGCDLPLSRRSDAIVIEDSDVSPLAETLFQLKATLRNRAKFDQAYPHLEITLTDTLDQPLLRKVLAPAEYLPQEAAGKEVFAARAELAVHKNFSVSDVKPVGYRLEFFYP